MDQNHAPRDVIIDWLADYTHFICDQFGVPHDQADGLLQQYLDLTARAPHQQPVISLSEEPVGYPDPSNHHYAPLIHPISHLPLHLQTQASSYSAPLSPHDETSAREETNHSSNPMAMTALTTSPLWQFYPHDQQPWNSMTMNSDFLEAGAPSPSRPQTQTFNQTPIGKITDYDPLWVQKDNVNPDQVRDFQSRMKFDTMFYHGVIKLGDVFTFQVLVSANGQYKKTEAHLKITGTSLCPAYLKNFPDLSLSVISDPSTHYPEAKAGRGTTAMIEHLQACNITFLGKGWYDIQVIRGQQALGSLWWFKQAFHLWIDKKDKEAEERGQIFRRRRARGKGKDLTQSNGVSQNGVSLPDPSQARHRRRG